jgi:hypothetical protein
MRMEVQIITDNKRKRPVFQGLKEYIDIFLFGLFCTNSQMTDYYNI